MNYQTTNPQTAEEILKENLTEEDFVYAREEDVLPSIINSMLERTRQALEEFKKECAERATVVCEYQPEGFIRNKYSVNKDSILSLDISKYLK